MKKKIIIPAFALLIGTALAGSVTSTVAWYQYSTRTNAAYIGSAAGTSENLQMRIRDYNTIDWTSRITFGQMETYLGSTSYGSKMVPITTGNLGKDDALPATLYQNPIAGIEAQTSWKPATAANYVVIPLQFRYVQRDGELEGGVDEAFVNKQVNLNELLIQKRTNSTHADISSAIRVHFHAYNDSTPATIKNCLVSNAGSTIETHGALDLDSEPGNDYTYTVDKYGFGGDTTRTLDYGNNGQNPSQQASYAASAVPINLGNTGAVADKYLNVDITIWVEGWQKLGASGSESAIWSLADYAASEFQVGFEFEAVDAQ